MLQGACSSFISVASTQSNFAKEKMYLTYTGRWQVHHCGQELKGDLETKPVEGMLPAGSFTSSWLGNFLLQPRTD